ncbi:unnamed protein product [Meloidogyne enterolobii]|uniref:Uncharacterized protein n=1 Tax=Meloidogyne enterolobii TaxID=390850 RepID=A0ACB0XYV8_MELEN
MRQFVGDFLWFWRFNFVRRGEGKEEERLLDLYWNWRQLPSFFFCFYFFFLKNDEQIKETVKEKEIFYNYFLNIYL